MSTTQTDWISAGSLDDLRKKGRVVVRAADRPVLVIVDGDRIRAIDNRCPHMGFPLHQGTTHDGVLTCHWHHARFDLSGGCAFDLFADDVPTFDVRLDGPTVFVSRYPRERRDGAYDRKRLRAGLEQNLGLIQAKSIVGLVDRGESFAAIATEIARFAQTCSEDWQDGLTCLAMVGNLWDTLSVETRVHALVQASRRVSSNTAGRPARRAREALSGVHDDANLLRRWITGWVHTRHRDGVERTLLTALESGIAFPEVGGLLAEALGCRVYAEQGHTLDALNKAIELLRRFDGQGARELLPLLATALAGGRGEEDRSTWINPVDLVRHIRLAESELADVVPEGDSGPPDAEQWERLLWGDDPAELIAGVSAALRAGTAPWRVAQGISYAAAMRLARFGPGNDVNDWFGPVHAFVFSNALCQMLRRSCSREIVRQLFHAASAVYMDRFVNVPAASLPRDRPGFDVKPEGAQELLDGMLRSLDSTGSLDRLPALVMRYLALGYDEAHLLDRLAFATVREDLDFHKLQVLEAAWQQARLWPPGPEIAVLYAAAARHLAAHCPTRRSETQMTRIAIKLHRGEPVHEA